MSNVAQTQRSVSPYHFALLRMIFSALFVAQHTYDLVRVFSRDATALAHGLCILAGVLIFFGVTRRLSALIAWGAWAYLTYTLSWQSAPYLEGAALVLLAIAPSGEALRAKHFAPLATFRLTTFVSALMFVLAFAQVCVWSTWLSPYLLTEGRVTLHTILFASLALISVAFLLREKGTLAFLFLFGALSATFFIEAFAGKGLSTFATLGALFFAFDERFVPPKIFAGKSTIFFDGVCTLCNTSVDFVIREDKISQFKFASLQGKLAQRRGIGSDEPESIVFAHGSRFLTKSDAALSIASGLGGSWRVLSYSRLLPKSLRDGVYDWVAKNRYTMFGKEESCRVPTESERALFLD